MSNDTPISEMKYNDLKSLAKERGLDSSGTKEDLVARLTDNEGTANEAVTDEAQAPSESQPEAEPQESGGAPEEKEDEILKPVANERVEQQKADKQLRADAKAMKAHLDKQPKVSIMIPFEVGENPEVGKKVKFPVNLNGYPMEIPRGTYVEVPKQVADLIKERLESEGKIGAQWRIDRDPDKQKALN